MIHKSKSEPAVSPIIGTILLVAIAVVLAAIILVVVMGFSGDTGEKKVGLNAKPEIGNNATLLLYGGASIDELVKLEMIDQDSPNGVYVEFWNSTSGDAFVGVPYPVENVARPIEDMEIYDTRINVRGTFRDGKEIVLLVQPMTFGNVNGPEIDISEYLSVFGFHHATTNSGITFSSSQTNVSLNGGLMYIQNPEKSTEYAYVFGKVVVEAKEGPTGIMPDGVKIQIKSLSPYIKYPLHMNMKELDWTGEKTNWDGSRLEFYNVKVHSTGNLGIYPKGPWEVTLTLYRGSNVLSEKTWRLVYDDYNPE